jgi:hypothetical protein
LQGIVNVSESEVSVFFLASPSTALLLVVGGSKCHAPDSRMFSCFFFTRFGGRGIFLVIDGKRMIIIMDFLNRIQEKKHGRQVLGKKAVVAKHNTSYPSSQLWRLFLIFRSYFSALYYLLYLNSQTMSSICPDIGSLPC